MKVTKTEHAMMTRLLEGPATYRQLGRAAGVSPDGARKAATRHILTRRPVVATYWRSLPVRWWWIAAGGTACSTWMRLGVSTI